MENEYTGFIVCLLKGSRAVDLKASREAQYSSQVLGQAEVLEHKPGGSLVGQGQGQRGARAWRGEQWTLSVVVMTLPVSLDPQVMY